VSFTNGKTIVIHLGNGNLSQGFPQITVRLWTTPQQQDEQVVGSLPAAPALMDTYRIWQSTYRALCSRLVFRLPPSTTDDDLEIDAAGVTQVSQQSFEEFSQQFQQSLNTWLKSETFLDLERQLRSHLHPSDEIRVIFEATDQLLLCLPWHGWDFFRDYPYAEMALSRPEYKRRNVVRQRDKQKVRILAVLGDRRGIDVAAEQQLLQELVDAEITFLVTPSRQDFDNVLWDAIGWDILFFAGHSQTEGETGRIYINENPVRNSLTVEQLEEALHRAIENGLKLAIFNSCDGAGLAQALEKLHIPQVVVMREPVPNRVAQAFLKYFLEAFAKERLSLHRAMRQARRRLQGLEDDFPGASWLPVLCQNPLVEPLTWLQLGGVAPCPYRGLFAFQEADVDLFLGREQVTHDLVTDVKRKSLIAVVGASGSGKSSVVFAGLVPRLRNSATSTRWQIISCRPGTKPFDALAEAFIELELPDQKMDLEHPSTDPRGDRSFCFRMLELAVRLQQEQQALCRTIEHLHRTHPETRLLLIVDQFEELYTLCPETDRQPFLNQLLDAVQFAPAFTLVLTLRADFYGYALSDRRLSDALQGAVYNLGPMSREELQRAIVQPAAQMQMKLESGLTDTLIQATQGQAGQLPLLEFALTELWSQQEAGLLTYRAYEAIGGVEEALANHAERVYTKLHPLDQQRMQRIMMQLVQPGIGTDSSRRLATRDEVGEANWDLVSHLASARLVVTNCNEVTGDETVEVVHEALIRNWGRLASWLQANGEFRHWQEELRRARRQWEKSDREDEALLRGKQLVIAKDWYDSRQDELSAGDSGFIRRSLAVQEQDVKQRRRRRQVIFSSLVIGFLAALLLSGIAWWGWQSAAVNEAKALNTSAKALLAAGQPFDALIESLRAKERLHKLHNMVGADPDLQDQNEFLLHRSIYRTTEFNRLVGHDNAIASVAFSPDGQTIASASWDNTIKLWKPDGTLIRTLTGHSDRLNEVVFSPDGQTIASAGKDKTIKLWKLNGTLLANLSGHRDAINSTAFSSDNETIASVSGDGEIRLWHHDGRSLRTIKGHQGIAWGVAFSPDGQTIATSGEDNTIKLWSLQGKLLNTISAHDDDVYGVAFSPDGKTIATASWDNTIKLWNINGSLITTLVGHTDRVYRAVFSKDGQFLVSASRDNTIKLWTLDGALPKTFKGHSDRVFSAAFSPDGKTIVSGSRDQTIRLWRLNNELVNTLIGHQGAVSQVAFSSDGQTIATAGWDNTVKLWTANGRLRRSLIGHTDRVNGIAFSPDGQAIASASQDKTVKLWNTVDGTLLRTLTGHQNNVNSVAFSPDGQAIASASWDKTIRLWKLDGTLLKTFVGHVSNMNRVVFSRDGRTILSASLDKSIDLWNLEGSLLNSVEGHEDEVYSVALSNDNQRIASASRDRTARLWSRDGKLLRVLSGHEDEVRDVAFSPDGQLVATASQDRTIKLWLPDGTLLSTLNGHDEGVNNVMFSPDGQTLASASQDGTVRLWNLKLVREGDRVDAYACQWVWDYLRERGGGGDRGFMIVPRVEAKSYCQFCSTRAWVSSCPKRYL
jgi:WD40 repeat protein